MHTERILLFILCLAAGSPPASLAAPAPFRLFEVGITRFFRDADSAGRIENGRLNALGQFTLVRSTPSSFVDFVPEGWLGKSLIYTEAWTALGDLGAEARANFRLGNGGHPVVLRGLIYYHVEPDPAARLDVAGVINLSTRGRIAPGAAPALVGGFVIDGLRGQTRRVLVRAIGPTLAALGVADAASDPFLSIHKGATPIYFNGNWGSRPDAAEIVQVAAEVGAFPLARTSQDAALLVELETGSYTASVVTEGDSGAGTALIEIYVLP